MKYIGILWDSSRIWGLMAWRSLVALGLPCRLVSGKEIAQGTVLGKQAALLLVPGGSGRRKARALGKQGIARMRGWVAAGGAYLGFCGGAGLALKQADSADGLELCPWERGNYADRLSHLLSGHVVARLHTGERASLPVWWPGRFAARKNIQIRVLAEYLHADEDLWLADRALSETGGNNLTSTNSRPDFEAGQPLVIRGKFGQGEYILSYAHLETPGSENANEWFGELIKELCGLAPVRWKIPHWHVMQANFSENFAWDEWTNSCARLAKTVLLGESLGLLFRRVPWLWGWRHGLAGMAINNLLTACDAINRITLLDCSSDIIAYREDLGNSLNFFCRETEKYFLDFHLALNSASNCGISVELARQNTRLFGHPMLGGGLAEKILAHMDSLIFRFQDLIKWF